MTILDVWQPLPGDYTIQLRSRGIEAHKFNKVIPRLTVAYNNRDHRKIMIIDGQFVYTGVVSIWLMSISTISSALVIGRIAVFVWMDRQLRLYQTLFICLVHQPWGNERL